MSSFNLALPKEYIACEQVRRISQSFSASISLSVSREATPNFLIHWRTFTASSARTDGWPSISTNKIEQVSLMPPSSSVENTRLPRCFSAASTVCVSKNSKTDGLILEPMSSAAASSANSSVRQAIKKVRRAKGLLTSLSVALVMIPSVPSDPIQRSRKLIPLTNFLKGAPHFTFSPVGRNPSRAYT